MLRVGVNLISIVPGETGGVETYARQLVRRLGAEASLDVVAFVAEEGRDGDWGAGVREVVLPIRARSRTAVVRAEQVLLPRALARAQCEVVHSVANTTPLRTRAARVTTVHDLLHRVAPDAHGRVLGLGLRVLVRAAVVRSHLILAPSRSTADDLVTLAGAPRERIEVIPYGATERFTAPAPERQTRARLRLGDRPVLLSPSGLRPHKNLVRLLEAHAALPASRPLLVLTGYLTGHEVALWERATALGTSQEVRIPGWVPAEDLEALYAMCLGVVVPSRYEGFGLPVLEAMARGVAVATSAGGSLAEVAGDAALLFDPEDPAQILAALRAITSDPARRGHLAAKGPGRASLYSWEACVERTVGCYRRAVVHGVCSNRNTRPHLEK